MSWNRNIQLVLALGAIVATAATTAAQCASYDFEDLPVGTAVTSQYDGVTFSVEPQSCGGNPTLYMRIADEFSGHSFSSQVLLIDTGCPDFSSDYLLMEFDDTQSDVTFTLGPWAGRYWITVYNEDDVPIQHYPVEIPGVGFMDVHWSVHVHRTAGDIKTIKIEESVGLFEAIDDLSFGQDDTPPTAEIHTPGLMDCVCGTVRVEGIACDYDGAYDRDRLEYLRVWPTADSDWTLIGEYVGYPVCEPGLLYNWDTTEPDVTDGVYLLRLTVINACGLSSNTQVTVYVDKEFDTLIIRRPLHDAIVGGEICFDGTVWDRHCFESYTVDYYDPNATEWLPVDPNNPVYHTTVINDPFAYWVAASGLPDGDYDIRVRAHPQCGGTATDGITLTLDNTWPVAKITEPFPCSKVAGVVEFIGTAADAHLDHWTLDYYDHVEKTWVMIATGETSLYGEVLGTWDTSGLDPCYYVVRLRVWDQAIVDMCSDPDPHRSDAYLAVAVGECAGDLDGDGDTDHSDLGILLADWGCAP
jgi:hypothetical protein